MDSFHICNLYLLLMLEEMRVIENNFVYSYLNLGLTEDIWVSIVVCQVGTEGLNEVLLNRIIIHYSILIFCLKCGVFRVQISVKKG